MKIFVQLVQASTGARSAAIGYPRAEVASVIRKLRDDPNVELVGSDYVLVLVDDAGEEEWQFSTAPLMSVDNFISRFEVCNV